MKTMRKNVWVLLALTVLASIMSACSSTQSQMDVTAASIAASVKPKEKTEVLDDKGAAFHVNTPAWVTAYIADGGNTGVQKLTAYKNQYCFVVDYADKNKDFAVTWVTNTSGPVAVAQKISTSVISNAKTALSGEGGAGIERNLEAAAEVMSNASFVGVTKNGDWWQTVRNTETGDVETRAFALYVVDKASLDKQVAANLQNIVDNNKEMSASERKIYGELIAKMNKSDVDLNS